MPADAIAMRGLSMRWTNLRVKTKILLGFGLVLLLFAGVSVTSYRAQTRVASGFADFVHTGEGADSARAASLALGELRRHAREFANTGDESVIKATVDLVPEVKKHIAAGLALTQHPERRTHWESMRDSLDSYMIAFGKVIELRREQVKLIKDRLDPAGSKARQVLDHLTAAAAQAGNDNAKMLGGRAIEALMLVRLNVNKAISRPSAAAAAAVEVPYAEFVKVIDDLDAVARGTTFRSDFDEAVSLSRTYYAAYQRAAVLGQDLEVLTNETMKTAAGVAASDVKFIMESGAAEEHQIKDDTEGLIAAAKALVMTLSTAGLVLGLVLAWLIGGMIARPMASMTAVMGKLADRDWAAVVEYQGQTDEIGQMAKAVQVFKDNGIENDRLAERQRAESTAKEARTKTIETLIAGFEKQVTNALQSLASSASELNATAASMAGTAEETTRQVTNVAAASEQATSNVQTVAVATEELSASVNEIGRQMEQSTRIAAQAVAEAEATTAAVLGLADMARNVDNVVKIISDIAGQTNLLALNATIEAARAGDAGKGFAVVASEVKALANRTAKATEEISQQINEMQTATGTSVHRIEAIAQTIAEMSKIATAIASAVEEQGAATQEIARNVQEAARGTGEVSSNINGVAQAASETGAAAAQVQATSGEVARQGEGLRGEVVHFLEGIRAA